ncbi:hypothetical protein SNE40_012037 [Patella caerulea]|uniref:Uncharacterized protein n=1 Tax=Patella caerulea TaxID=87958 RepID=A0AAN8JQR1_PATCE
MAGLFISKKLLLFLTALSFLVIWILYMNGFHEYFMPKKTSAWIIPKYRRMENSSNWIVVTANVEPTDAIKYMSTLPKWKLLVVANSNTPKDWKLADCVYLSLAEQHQFKISKLIPTESYSRKTVGFLYAITKGADTIYDLDDTINLLSDLDDLVKREIFEYGLQYDGKVVFNQFNHFGQSTIWPRGYPMKKISENGTNRYLVSSFKKPSVLQILSNGDPDIDPVFRLTLKPTKTSLNISFDNAAPPVVIPPGVFAAINSQTTLFHYVALWAMVLPITTHYLHSDIIRGYWAQRLLWEIGEFVGFHPPDVYQTRNNRSYALREDSRRSHFDPNKLIDFVIDWKCPVALRFFQCVNLLSGNLAQGGYWQQEDHQLVQAWIQELENCGYKEPIRKPFSDKNVIKHFNSAVYIPAEKKIIWKSKILQQSKWNQLLGMTSFCKDTSYQIKSSSLASVTFPDLLLVIVFNFPHYDNIPYLQLIYSVAFRHIVYCGPNMERFIKASKQFANKFTFVESVVDNGHCPYTCLSAAMKMNFDVQGYFMVADDTLLNSWNILKLPLDKIWFHFADLFLFKGKTNPWHWWQKPIGQSAMNKAWRYLYNVSADPHLKPVVDKFVHTLLENNVHKGDAIAGPSDIVYIPRKYKNDAIFLLDVFGGFKVFLEIAIPMVVNGLEVRNSSVHLEGQYLWYDGKREKVPEIFKSSDIFLHPVKLSNIKTNLKIFFCKTYFPFTINEMQTKLHSLSKTNE